MAVVQDSVSETLTGIGQLRLQPIMVRLPVGNAAPFDLLGVGFAAVSVDRFPVEPPRWTQPRHRATGIQRIAARRSIEIHDAAAVVRCQNRCSQACREVVELIHAPIRIGQALRRRRHAACHVLGQPQPRVRYGKNQARRAAFAGVEVSGCQSTHRRVVSAPCQANSLANSARTPLSIRARALAMSGANSRSAVRSGTCVRSTA